MKWLRVEHAGQWFFAILEDGQARLVEGSPFASHERTSLLLPLDTLRVLPPVVPQTFYAAGLNYAGHVAEMSERMDPMKFQAPKEVFVSYRANNALIGHGEAIVIPSGSSGAVQYEPELVAVIGRPARRVPEAEALDYVLGYSIGNDVSERTWQAKDRTLWRAKNADTFKPMGPWIETEVDLDSLVTKVRLNGRPVAEFRTNTMIFSVARYISEISQFNTLSPGDIIWMGAEAPTADMVAGDSVEVEITGIGTLCNPVVAEGR